ncbi:hypothetical protein MMC07_008918 [Pseudocyphellaria aurata]|nr:hypothetical protein [Pseudocyphellaria aurata]
MDKSAAVGSTPVPPYESNPQYGAPPPVGQYGQSPPPMMHQDYIVNQAPNPGQYPQQPMSPPPQGEIKPEGSYYAPPQHPGMGQQQTSQPQVVVMTQSQPQQQQFHTATPLPNLGEGPAPVDCPSCRTRAVTRTQYVSGNTTM